MNLKIYNTLTRKLEVFKPLKKKSITMFSCGPTLHSKHTQIGNLRSYIFADLVKRYFIYSGFSVKHVIKITDVDDHIIKETGGNMEQVKEYTDNYLKDYISQLDELNIIRPDFLPRVSDHIGEITRAIKKLESKGHTYHADGSIYFDVSKCAQYGELTQINKQKWAKLNAQGRLNLEKIKGKLNENDFCLWKAWVPNERDVFWQTGIGKGRPGWHIGCSVLAMKYLGETLDFHIGGISHIFPHHTNEIAQSESISGKKFVNYWLHHDYLIVDGYAMTEEHNNVFTLSIIKERGFDPILLRIILLNTHYGQKLNFTFSKFKVAEEISNKILDFLLDLDFIECKKNNSLDIDKIINDNKEEVEVGIESDFNISLVFSSLFKFINIVNGIMDKINIDQAKKIKDYLYEIDKILGFIDVVYSKYKNKRKVFLENSKIIGLIDQRQKARKDKDYELADKIRDTLYKEGVVLVDRQSDVIIKLVATK